MSTELNLEVQKIINERPELLTTSLKQHFKNINDFGVSVLIMHRQPHTDPPENK